MIHSCATSLNSFYCFRLCLSLSLLCLFLNFANAQKLQLGLPIHEHFDYELENHFSTSHDSLGNLFLAANNQVIKFRGYFDPIIESASSIKALLNIENSLYYGGDKSYGKIKVDSSFKYSLISEFSQTEDYVTRISVSNYGQFILSKNTVFHFTDKVAKKYTFPGIVDYLDDVNGSTILHDDTNGLSLFVGGRFKIVNNSRFLAKMKVMAIKSVGSGEYIVATRNNGLYRFDGETFLEFAKGNLGDKEIIDIEVVENKNNDGEIILITANKEFITLNFSGAILQEKLIGSPLYDLHKDNSGRVYLISKKGVDVFYYNLPYQIVDLSMDQIHGPINIYNNKFYWGTNNGLYYSNLTESGGLMSARIRVKDTEGKVGKLNIVNETLLMSHEDGLYDILPKVGARFIPDETFYDFKELSGDYLLGFSNRRAYLLKKKRKKWRVEKVINDFPIHPKTIVYTNEDLWLVDRDYNLIHYSVDLRKKEFIKIDETRNKDKVDIFLLKEDLILVKDKKAYTYQNNSFEESNDLTKIFGETINLEQLINDQYGNVWYIQNKKVGLFRSSIVNGKKTYRKLEVEYPNQDPRYVFPYDKNNVFINNGDHFIKLDLENYTKRNSSELSLDRIYCNKKGIINNHFISSLGELENLTVKPSESVHFVFNNDIGPSNVLSYQLLKDEQTVRSGSSKFSKISFSNLIEGSYDLNVNLTSYNGDVSSRNVDFDVRKSFFTTTPFYIILGIINLLIIGLAFYLGYRIGTKPK